MERNRFDREDTYFSELGKIAAGVFIGALAAMFAYEGISALRVEYALRQADEQIHRSMNADRQRMRLEEQARAARQQRDIEDAQALESARNTARRLQLERERRRSDAWEKFYQPSTSCLDDPSTVVCANEHMAARKRFDAQYKDR